MQDTVYSLTEPRWKDPEYTERQYAEVEWIMTGAMDKALPSVCMNVAMILMFIGEGPACACIGFYFLFFNL